MEDWPASPPLTPIGASSALGKLGGGAMGYWLVDSALDLVGEGVLIGGRASHGEGLWMVSHLAPFPNGVGLPIRGQ